jgi:hypothetical protein
LRIANPPILGPTPRVLVLVLALAVLSQPVRAGETAGSVRVGPVRLEAPRTPLDRRLSVTVSIGQRALWRSPATIVAPASWPVRLRAYTAKDLPLVFDVVSVDSVASGRQGPLSPRPTYRSRSLREQDAALASALPDLVSDYGTGTLTDPGESPGRAVDPGLAGPSPFPSGARRVQCRARLAWPPADGSHRLQCGPYSVVVETTWMGGGKKAGR